MIILLALLLASSDGAPLPSRPSPARPALATGATACRPTSARRCDAAGCQDASEGLHAEVFMLDVAGRTLGACLYTDCYSGAARLVRDRQSPWLVTAFGEVRSERRAGGPLPQGSAPFPLTVTVDLRDGAFSAIWSLSPAGLQVDFGRCELRGPGR